MCAPLSMSQLRSSNKTFTKYCESQHIDVADPLFELLHVIMIGEGDLREFTIEWMARNTKTATPAPAVEPALWCHACAGTGAITADPRFPEQYTVCGVCMGSGISPT